MLPQFSPSDIARFWIKIDKRGPDECWPWIASLDKRGYGQFAMPVGRMIKAHRIALFLSTGIDPDDLCTLHSCDNPACCNPKHLRTGTKKDNVADMMLRGRVYRGPKYHAVGSDLAYAKLTESQVIEIRRLKPSGVTYAVLAARYGLTPGAICDIVKGRTWKHVPLDHH